MTGTPGLGLPRTFSAAGQPDNLNQRTVTHNLRTKRVSLRPHFGKQSINQGLVRVATPLSAAMSGASHKEMASRFVPLSNAPDRFPTISSADMLDGSHHGHKRRHFRRVTALVVRTLSDNGLIPLFAGNPVAVLLQECRC